MFAPPSALQLLITLIAATGILSQVQQNQLVVGTSLEREIAGGQIHTLRCNLTSGQFVQLGIQQQGEELTVSILGPAGEKVFEDFEPAGETSRREILFITPVEGDFQLIVRPQRDKAPSGRYSVMIEVARPALENDRKRVLATQLVKEGRQAYWKVRPLTAEEANSYSAKFEEALKLWQSLEDNLNLAETFLDLGIVRTRMMDYPRAIEYYEKALPLFPERPEEAIASKATTFNNLADIYRRLGELRKSLEYFQLSLALKKPGRSRAISLDNIGGVYYALSDYQQAMDYHQQALTMFRSQGNIRDEAVALNNIANVWGKIGDLNRSLDYLKQALVLIRRVGDKNEEAGYLYNAGNCTLAMSDYVKALEYTNQAMSIFQATKNMRGYADAMTLTCKTFRATGEYDKAMNACNIALPLHRTHKDRPTEYQTLSTMSSIYEKQGDRIKALELRLEALRLNREIGDPSGELSTLHSLGKLAVEDGKLEAARGYFEQAIAIGESVRLRTASQQLRSYYLADLQGVFESQLDLLMRLHEQRPHEGFDRAALQFSERARARGLLDMLAEAKAEIREGADRKLLDHERSLLERIIAKDASLRRFRNNERTKDQAEALSREISDLTTELRVVEAKVRSSNPKYAALTEAVPLSTAEIQRDVLDAQTVLLEFSLGEKQSWLWALTQNAVTSYRLPSRSEINASARRFYESITARQPASGLSVAEQQKRVAEADARLQHDTATLGRMLFEPIAAKFDSEWKGKRMAIVASGMLEYVPFAALVAGNEVVVLPSASTLAMIRREVEGRKPSPKLLAVLADPVFETSDPRLALAKRKAAGKDLAVNTRSADSGQSESMPGDLTRSARSFGRDGFGRLVFSSEEAASIARLAPEGAVLKALGFQATRVLAASGELSRYRIVHFATHGLINTESPELSGLVLSLVDENGRPQDGFLRMHEIFNLKLPADLVVLSACQTALGKQVKGEGLIGLTRGFMYAGAQRVVASLWQVDDQATAQLMRLFYQGILKEGLAPSASLRAAQVEMSKQKRWSSPYYWAGFVIQGEYK